jgi:cation/acetate symporter
MDFVVAVYVGLVGILLCAMLGGMRAVTWTQVAQYIVLIVAYLTPVIILSSQKYGLPFPQLTYGSAIQEITALEQNMLAQGWATAANLKPHTQPFTSYSPLNYFGLIFCLMVGTASLPHVLMRYFTTPSVREARISVAWSLFFIFLLYFTAPAYAAFSKLEVYSNVIGKPIAAFGTDPALSWVFTYGKLELVKICGANAIDVNAITAACQKIAGHPGVVRLQDFSINADVIVLSTPEIAGMPYVIAGLVAAGGLAAALSTADGLLLAIANALSHDIYYKMIDRHAPAGRRLIIARILLVGVAVAAAYTASTKPADILAMVSWAFSLAAAGLFPALVMGIWWKRANAYGAVAGIIAGFGITLMYLVVTRYYPQWGIENLGMYSNLNPVTWAPVVDIAKVASDPAVWNVSPVPVTHPLASKVGWFNVNNISSALFGLPLGFLTIFIVSLLTPAPSQRMYDFLDEVRRPRGETVLKDKDPGLVPAE